MDVYGELPTVYPLCIYDFRAINKVAYIKANITGHTVVPPSDVKEGDLFEGGLTGYQIYHGSWTPLADYSWFEVTHTVLPTELKGSWVWRQRGSGIWYNTGKTIVFPTPAKQSEIHKEAINFFTANCSITPSAHWPQQESDIFGFCAREKGFDTIQFEPTPGQDKMGTFGLAGLTEVVLVGLDGKYSCGVEDAGNTPLREGWKASRRCDCENVQIPDSCGLMARPPFPLNIIGTKPPLCKLQAASRWASCDPTACGQTSCGPKVVEPRTPAPTIVDFAGAKTKNVGGRLYKCCCRSDVIKTPEKSTEVVCELVPVASGAGAGCKQLKGRGWHSWNNMGQKYRNLKHFNECAVPSSEAE